MFPLLSIIIALLLGLSYLQFHPEGTTQPDLVAAAFVLVATVVSGRVMTARAVRQARREEPVSPGPLLQALSMQRMLVVASYGIVVYVCHWPALVHTLGIGGWVLVDEILTFLPFLFLIFEGFFAAWRAEHALDLHDFSKREYVLFQSRQFLLPISPILFFLLFSDLLEAGSAAGIEWIASFRIAMESYPFVQWLVFGALLFGLYCLIPFLMRWMWGLTSMPAGPLRDRLEEFSEREGFRARDLLVWPTGGNILNAAVIGIAARFRYVLMTDALINELSPDEVEAVFAHEVGHAKHNHLLKFFIFIFGYSLLLFVVVTAFEAQLAPLLDGSIVATLAFLLGGVLLWFGLLMGFVSRRFEQQADVYGALSIGRVRGNGADPSGDWGDDHPFVRALTRIGMQLGDIRENKGWRHFSLGSRIAFIRRFLADDVERRKYRRRIAGLMLFFFGLLGTIGVAAALTIPDQVRRGRAVAASAWANWYRDQGRLEEATANQELRHVIWLQMNGWYDAAASEDLDPRLRIQAMSMLARGYLALDMPHAARHTVDEVLRGIGGDPLPAMVEADLLEILGVALAREGRPRGARLALEDALALLPPAASGAKERIARIRSFLKTLEPRRNR